MFINEAKESTTDTYEIQVSSDIVNLYLLVLLGNAIEEIIEFLRDEYIDVTARTELNLTNIYKVLEICLCEYHFLYNNDIWKLHYPEPTRLSIMVVISECYLQRLEERSIAIALTLEIAPKTFK